MRFDDSLETVLSAEMSSSFGAQSTWRQLVDLIGRGRAGASGHAIARLRAIRDDVPPPVRAASARALAFATPPAGLVALFADDEIAVAAPVLRTARLDADEWTALLPAMSPAARSVLRHRRDLPPAVGRALESFGSVDFVLAAPEASAVLGTAPAIEPLRAIEPVEDAADAEPEFETGSAPALLDWTEVVGDAGTAEPLAELATAVPEQRPDGAVADVPPGAPPAAPRLAEPQIEEPPVAEPSAEAIVPDQPVLPASSFVSIAAVAAGLPVVAEALRLAERPEPVEPAPAPTDADAVGPFPISELVARIDAYTRRREVAPAPPAEDQPELFAREPVPVQAFRFETDAAGVVRWIEGAARAPLIGLTLDLGVASAAGARVDGVAAGAFRRRAGFADARLVVDGHSDAAGPWRITGLPVFDRASGRFTGYRGTARRPRADESAEPAREARNPAADALRQLVHELRTPTNAIAGFAEMIEQQVLGPVPAAYRAHAAAIRAQTGGLLGAIDDIDMAARIETHALDLRPGDVPVGPLLARIAGDLAPLAALRGATLDHHVASAPLAILGDDRAVERLVSRIMATLVASAAAGERVGVSATCEDGAVVIAFDRPAALADYGPEALLTIDAEDEHARAGIDGGSPLLGTGFALRLARNLAAELRGSLSVDAKRLTLRLPAAEAATMEQASFS